MKTRVGYSGLPGALLTFSLLLMVLVLGFVVGRAVVARAYLSSAPKFDLKTAGGTEPVARERRAPPGPVHVPSPPSNRREKSEEEARQEERGAEAEAETPEPIPPVPQPPVHATEGEPVVGQEGAPALQAQPEEAPRPEKPEPEEANNRTYSIQVGVFTSLSGARQVVDELARAGYPARIAPETRGSQELYRVLTGRYRSEYAARKALEQLRTEGFEAFLAQQ